MHKRRWMANSILSVCLASSCTFGHAKSASPKALSGKQVGIASYYSDRFHGRRTANGERYDKDGLTAVHHTLPFGTVIRVVNLENDRSIEVRVNDRGKLRRGRILDLSRRAARELGFVHSGLANVELEIVAQGD
jgi:rare lipoprotein A